MLPSAEGFCGDDAGKLGIGDDDTIVVYDGLGLFSSPRVWWMFRLFGAREGLHPRRRHAEMEGRRSPDRVRRDQRARHAILPRACNPGAIAATLPKVQSGARRNQTRRWSMRAPAERFRGDGAGTTARLALRPHAWLAQRALGRTCWKTAGCRPAEQLRNAFAAGGVDIDKPVITTCGSGVSAATCGLRSTRSGSPRSLYDGSWSEWGARRTFPRDRPEIAR